MRMLANLALLVTLSGCVTTQATLMNPVTRSFTDKDGIRWMVREVVTHSKTRALRFTQENGVTSRHIVPPPDAWRTADEDELRKLLSRSMNGPGR